MAASPLGTLLTQSVNFYQKHWKPILLGALVFGTISSSMKISMVSRLSDRSTEMMQTLGVDPSLMAEYQRRLQMGDSTGAQQIAEQMGDKVKTQIANMTEEERQAMVGRQVMGMFALAPTFGLGLLLSILFGVIASVYYFLIALRATNDVGTLLKEMVTYALPMCGLWIWMFLRSFAWIPFIGVIPAIIFYPRFIAAPLLMIEQKKGIVESVSMSMEKTQGYWPKIVGNFLVVGVCAFIASILLGVVIGAVALAAPSIGTWAMAAVQQGVSVFFVVFGVFLARTILANPVSKKA